MRMRMREREREIYMRAERAMGWLVDTERVGVYLRACVVLEEGMDPWCRELERAR